MFFTTILISTVIAMMECSTEIHYITGPTWKNEIKKCWSGGSAEDMSSFQVGTLDSLELKYEDIHRSNTTIVARGRLQIYTKGTGTLKESTMLLKHDVESSYYNKFSNSWEESATLGWATQEGRIRLDIYINRDGSIKLYNYVYAYSWGAVTCAETKAYVESIEIIQNYESRKQPLTVQVQVIPKSRASKKQVSLLLHTMFSVSLYVFLSHQF